MRPSGSNPCPDLPCPEAPSLCTQVHLTVDGRFALSKGRSSGGNVLSISYLALSTAG
jgi:hypothetical protein